MVDDDDDMNFDDDGEDAGGGDDEEEEMSPESQYYTAKSQVEDSVSEALETLQTVLDLEDGKKSEWGFKALKKMIKLYFKQKNYKKVVPTFKQLTGYLKVASSNLCEKGLFAIFNISTNAGQHEITQQLFELAAAALLDAKNYSLWLKVSLKLADMLLDAKEHTKLADLLEKLHKWCTVDNAGLADDPKKSAQLVQVYAMKIQLNQALKNNKQLKVLVKKALQFISGIPAPKIVGTIRECSGMVNLEEGDYARADKDFFEAFKNFDEAGSPHRVQCLHYLVFTRIIELSEIDPFSSPETLPYKKVPEIQEMVNIWKAYERLDIKLFEKLIHESVVVVDPFMSRFVPQFFRNVRSHVMLKLIKPYSRFHLPFISKEIGVSNEECERLLVSLILDNKVRGHLDQLSGTVVIESQQSTSHSKYSAMGKWNRQLGTLRSSVCAKIQ